MDQVVLPFCGAAPLPSELWTRWTLDPVLLGLLAFLPAGYHLALRQAPASGRTGRERLFFWLGWATLVVAFVSPLCALSAALFSARVAHHVLLVAVAAPFFALANPWRETRPLPWPGLWLLVHAVALWFWHAPVPYDAALRSDTLYWLMQGSLLLTALGFWSSILSTREAAVTAPLMLLAAMMQMGLLGALITFAPRPLYVAHFLSPEPFGLTALSDQQLAGLIMWAPGALPYLVAALAVAAAALRKPLTAN
ncbi:cytochrome c oxidase assembly protein [Aureimonas mangrovi]|uniref:cytochrome c oxidase assembly protein n=1 Tax=Aureimonas mangrovi TaxID=2758041 RepID=UPI00163D9D31|nr:cytochrome c oxidase assembly protein [Aureimonas mangrovi]